MKLECKHIFHTCSRKWLIYVYYLKLYCFHNTIRYCIFSNVMITLSLFYDICIMYVCIQKFDGLLLQCDNMFCLSNHLLIFWKKLSIWINSRWSQNKNSTLLTLSLICIQFTLHARYGALSAPWQKYGQLSLPPPSQVLGPVQTIQLVLGHTDVSGQHETEVIKGHFTENISHLLAMY